MSHPDPETPMIVKEICQRPGLYVQPATFEMVCAYLSGFDAARSFGPLAGLREWLIVRLKDGDNLNWIVLMGEQIAKHPPYATSDESKISAMPAVLHEFFETREQLGVTDIYYQYAQWLIQKGWYSGSRRKRD